MIQETLSSYSVHTFNKLAEKYDFTVLYSDKRCDDNIKFNVIHNSVKTIGPFAFFKKNILNIMREYDFVICSPYIKYINIIFASLIYGRKRVIYYGIGVAASYKNHFDSKKWVTYIFSNYLKLIGSCVFYSNYPIEVYKRLGVNEQKMFVANNTTYVNIDENFSKRYNTILFIGTLYKEKGIRELLQSYNEVYLRNSNINKLVIIGDGEEMEFVQNYTLENNLTSKVEIVGSLFDEKQIAAYFMDAVACISPNQAGLSVLKSIGYGVPFITKRTAITGGEIFNIIDNFNGIIYEDDSELSGIIENIYEEKEKFIDFGKNAREYYLKHCTIDIMAEGFINAIDYAKENNIKK